MFYFGLQMWIGLSIPGGNYSSFIDQYIDFFHLLRISLIKGARFIAFLCGISTQEEAGYTIREINPLKIGHKFGVRVSYGCAGIGVMSFWAAFVLSNTLVFRKKIIWIIAGFTMIWIINATRIGLTLVAGIKNWPAPLGIDHHTWFNVISYGAVLVMMYFLDKKTRR